MRDDRSAFDRICIAISLIQSAILARDTALLPDVMFGSAYMPSLTLEEAERLLRSVVDEVDVMERKAARESQA